MAAYDPAQGPFCCRPPTPGLRMLTFPDGTQAGVLDLNEILAAVYEEGRQVSTDTAEEIVERLAVKNYIIPSARKQYSDVILEEYAKYVESRADKSDTNAPLSGPLRNQKRRRGILSRLLKKS